MMKIVCVGYLHGSGGAERQIVMLANALAKRGYPVHLIVLAAFNNQYEIDDRVIVCDLSGVESKKGIKVFLRYKALRKILGNIKPDVSIHYWLQSVYLAALMPKKISGKIIYSERGDPGDSEYNGLLGRIRRIAFRKTDGFVFQSEGARDYFDSNVRNKSTVIHNAVSIPVNRYIEPCRCREKRIVSVGRLHPQKNQKILIEAFSKIADKFPEYQMEIYGEGELEKDLIKQIQSLNLSNRICLMGSRKDIFGCIYSAALFVLSSDYEGMPNALMEAMALGIPCISTDCKPGGARTLINNDVNGWIVPANDSLALSTIMEIALSDKEKSEGVAAEAMKIRNTHTITNIFDRWERYIQAVTGGKRL